MSKLQRRAVIVYERAGQGHLAAAEVLRSILQAEEDVEVILQDGEGLERDTPGSNPIVILWNGLIRLGWFRLADLLINHLLRLVVFPVLVVTQSAKVKTRLKALRPDAVLSTADIFNRALGDAANELGVPFTVLPIEFSIFADLLHPDAHYLCYFEETARCIRRFDLNTPHFTFKVDERAPLRKRLSFLAAWFRAYGLMRTEPLLFQSAGDSAPGHNALACHVVGPLREPRDHAPGVEPPPERPQILVVSGSLGGRFVFTVTRALLAMRELDADVVAICGRDTATLEALRGIAPESGSVRLECCGYVDDMPDRLRRASVLLARPSATLFLEAILACVPLLTPARATKNDSGTVHLTRNWGIGETYEHEQEIPMKLAYMMSRLGVYRWRLKGLRTFDEPRENVEARIRSVAWRSINGP